MINSESRIRENLPSGCYRSPDNIKNFKIRICLRKLSPSFLPLPEGGSTNNHGTDLELQSIQTQDKNSYTQHEFRWQEKISKEQKEICSSASQTSPKQLEDNANYLSNIKLFTYVDSELRSTESLKNGNCSFSKKECILRRRNLFRPDTKTYQKPFIVDEKDVIKKSTPEKKELPIESMTIVAVLEQDDNNSEEIQLCLIRHDVHGALTVSPDFSKEPYYVQNSSLETFEYKIENASKYMSKIDAEKEKRLMKQISQHHSDILTNAVGTSFDVPPKDTILWHLNGEIDLAKDFEGRYIFVQYFLQPCKWLKLDNIEQSSGVTQSCRLKTKKSVTFAQFGFPFSCTIPIRIKELKSDEEVPSLRMIVEVVSMDFWGILRNEGYGFCDIPFTPGCHTFTIRTWKLLPSTIIGRLENYFLGGGPTLDDFNFVTIPEEVQLPCLGKYGIRTQSSGSVSIKMQMLMHFGSETSTDNLINK